MSLITRCPACQTLFKVESDQLQASDGWARCGQCHQAFNAREHLVPTLDPGNAIASPAQPVPAVNPAVPTIDAPPQVILDVEASVLTPGAETGNTTHRRSSWPVAGWSLLALLLAGGLLLQVLLHERNQIAIRMPHWRPVLEQLCAWTGCNIGAPRRIDAIVIDGSAFNRLGGDLYRLSFTLRNKADIDLALPSLELSLTDAQDRVVLRRVLPPAEFHAADPVLPAGTELAGALALHLDDDDDAEPAGYRLLAFYP